MISGRQPGLALGILLTTNMLTKNTSPTSKPTHVASYSCKDSNRTSSTHAKRCAVLDVASPTVLSFESRGALLIPSWPTSEVSIEPEGSPHLVQTALAPTDTEAELMKFWGEGTAKKKVQLKSTGVGSFTRLSQSPGLKSSTTKGYNMNGRPEIVV